MKYILFFIVALILNSCGEKKVSSEKVINTQIVAEYVFDDTMRCIVYDKIFCSEVEGEKKYHTKRDSVQFHQYLPYTYNQDYEEGLAFIRRRIHAGETDVEHLIK